MNTIEALEYLRNNPKAVVVKRQEELCRQLEMNVEQDLFDWSDEKYIQFKLYYDSGIFEEVDFSEWVKLDDEWEIKNEIKYHVRLDGLPKIIEKSLHYGLFLNYNKLKDYYYFSTKEELDGYKTEFTESEIENIIDEHLVDLLDYIVWEEVVE